MSGYDGVRRIEQGRLTMTGSLLGKYLPRYALVAFALVLVGRDSDAPNRRKRYIAAKPGPETSSSSRPTDCAGRRSSAGPIPAF